MPGKDLTITYTVDQTPEEVFAAVNDVRGWWSGAIDGPTDRLGAEFTYHYQTLHRSVQRITEWEPGRKVVWHIVDAHLSFVKDPREWVGTDVVFEIRPKGTKTELRFTHVGLVPSIECYGGCSDAWGFYIRDSLKARITTGKGQATTKAEADA